MSKTTTKSVMQFTKDEHGKDILLKNGALQVMMEWEKPYMQACVDVLAPKGDVLEIGFGFGYSADAIEKHHPKSHTIIESDPTVFERLQAWAKKNPEVTVIFGKWEETIQNLNKFDAIFFDDNSPNSEVDLKRIESDTKQYQQASEQMQGLKEAISENLKLFKGVKFSDFDLQQFSKQIQSRSDVSHADVIEFIDMLVTLGNISREQRDAFLATSAKPQKEVSSPSLNTVWLTGKENDIERFTAIAQVCLDKHLRIGGKVAGPLRIDESLKKDLKFKNAILARDDIQFTEKFINVDVPVNCQYCQGDKALFVVVQKTK